MGGAVIPQPAMTARAGVGREPVERRRGALRFVFPPSLGPVQANVRAELLSKVLSARLGRPVLIEVAKSYDQLERRVLRGEVDVAWAPPTLCEKARAWTHPILRAVRGGASSYRAAFVGRRTDGLRVDSLYGKRAAWIAPSSTAGYLLAVAHLRSLGFEPDRILGAQCFLGSYREAISAVKRGAADFTSLYTSGPDEPSVLSTLLELTGTEESRLVPFAYTDPSRTDGIILSPELSVEDAEHIARLLLDLNNAATGSIGILALFHAQRFELESPRSAASDRRGEEAKEVGPAEICSPGQAVPQLTVLAFDEQGRVQDAFGAAQILGRQLKELTGTPAAKLLPKTAADRFEALASRRLSPDEPARFEFMIADANGPDVPTDQSSSRRRDKRRILAEIVRSAEGRAEPKSALVLQDVTDARRIEEELFHLASYPLLNPFPQLEVDLRGEVLFANPAARRAFPDLFDRSSEHPIVRAAVELSAKDNDAPPGSGDLRAPREVSIADRAFEVTADRSPELERIRVFVADVSERKRIEAQLIRADRLASMGMLAAGVGHEINNPLAYVIENVEFARQRIMELEAHLDVGVNRVDADLTELNEALAGAAEGAERIRIVVRDLRNMCRADDAPRGLIDVRDVLDSATTMLRNQLRFRGRVDRELGPVPLIDASSARLGQVFMNLIQNAAHALPEGGAEQNWIRLVTRTDAAGRAVVEVHDSGAGMTPEVQARIFEPFFTTKPAGVGTGLGLSISHSIVTGLGGEIKVASEPGRGSTITVTLPPARSPASEAPKASPQRPASPGARRILVIDDEPSVARSIKRILVGHEVVEAVGGQAALDVLQSDDRFDLVLCDLMMPQTTGMDVYETLQATRPAVADRLVFMTGGAFTRRASDFLKKVTNPRIEKPFEPSVLRELISAG